MTFAVSIIAIAAVLSGAVIGILTVLVIGIHSDDRAKNLTATPRTHTEAVTRLLLGVGVRSGHADHGKNEQP